jgi:hypothetical protein
LFWGCHSWRGLGEFVKISESVLVCGVGGQATLGR